MSFCAHTILEDDILVVEDATADSRFSDNLVVTSEPHLRFYAGVPLAVSDQISLGSLCVIDRKPRHLTGEQLDALRILGSAVITLLELRRALFDFRDVAKLIPICPFCRNIKSSDGQWQKLEEYVAKSSTVPEEICPECEQGLQFTS
jgi:hypothetical protein